MFRVKFQTSLYVLALWAKSVRIYSVHDVVIFLRRRYHLLPSGIDGRNRGVRERPDHAQHYRHDAKNQSNIALLFIQQKRKRMSLKRSVSTESHYEPHLRARYERKRQVVFSYGDERTNERRERVSDSM